MEVPWNFFDDLLPPEVTTEIFAYLSLEDVVYVSLVCKNWNLYFDTKQIWKRIFVLEFGPIDKNHLNIGHITRWGRLCLSALNARKWARNLKKTGTTCSLQLKKRELMRSCLELFSPKHHFIAWDAMIMAIDIKTAGKLLPVKVNPIKYFSTLQYERYHRLQFKENFDKSYDQKSSKNDSYEVPDALHQLNVSYGFSSRFALHDEKGRILSYLSQNRYLLWDYSTHNITNNLPSKAAVLYLPHFTTPLSVPYFDSMNSQYACWIEGVGKYGLIDLRKKCTHNQLMSVNESGLSFNMSPTTCPPESCSNILVANEPCLLTFASHIDLSLVLFFDRQKIIVWQSGKPLKEIPYESSTKTKRFECPCSRLQTDGIDSQVSENVTIVNGVKRHWIQFYTCIGNVAIVDLNDTDNRVVIPRISKFHWVPKENKAVLASQSKLVVYDLDRQSWSVKINLCKRIKALTFNSTGNILFVADDSNVHVIFWRTGLIIGTIETNLTVVNRLHLALNQILVLTSDSHVVYKKMLYPCSL